MAISDMRWIVTVVVVLLTTTLALGDHGVPPRNGFDWTTWLLVAGAVGAVSLGAWAFFAPDRGEDRPKPVTPDRSDRKPPTR